jgi:hypothetical protein
MNENHERTDRSFYEMKEDYLETIGFIPRLYPLLERKSSSQARRYQLDLMRRSLRLVKILADETSLSSPMRTIQGVELGFLIAEMRDYRTDTTPLIRKIKIMDEFPLKKKILDMFC